MVTYFNQVRFKWYQHIIFWSAYILFWSVRDLVHHEDIIDNIQLNTTNGILPILVTYFNIYFLVPSLLLRRKYLLYIGALVGSLILIAFLNSRVTGFYLDAYEITDVANFFRSVRGVVVLFFEAFVVVLITLAMVLTRIYLLKDKVARELTKKNLEAELDFLKNQINPHFLFNSLNSIYFLIPKNPQKAAETLLKFSDMLSHQLHHGGKDFIQLTDEIKNLEDFIDLEKVRQGNRVKVNWQVNGEINGQQIAPMILLTFLENAFKHGQQSSNDVYEITGGIDLDNNQLKFELKNEISNDSSENGGHGVGLENTRRRLELLYPDRHDLKIENAENYFRVVLKLHLHEIRCLIVDDEPLAREGLAGYCEQIPFLDLIGTCRNAEEALKSINQGNVDLVFMDIQMPRTSGMELVKSLTHPPVVIFTTAFRDYAAEGFEVNAMDYLLKPISFERFLKGVNKAYEHLLTKQSGSLAPGTGEDFFFVKCDGKFVRVHFDEILFIEGMKDYTIIYRGEEKLIVLVSLKKVEENLKPSEFIRVHKSYIVAKGKVNSIEGNQLKIDKYSIPVSKGLKDEVVSQIIGDKLWKRG